MPYFKDISIAYKTLKDGLKLTFSHLKDATKSREPLGVEEENYFDQQNGLFTTQYPFESLPVPDNGRYRLDNEIDDCIVCDKCAKICPVNCIDIEPIKSTEEIGKTSDGTSKRLYAAKFDIDMAKCCFCGLCTTVCPTECLTMTKAYDFSEFEVKLHNYAFGNMSDEEISEKKQEEEAAAKKKEEERLAKLKAKEEAAATVSTEDKPKPKFVPKVKPKATSEPSAVESSEAKPKPKFKPKVKSSTDASSEAKPKPKFKPKIKSKSTEEPKSEETTSDEKPKFRPKIKPKVPKKDESVEAKTAEPEEEKPKPKFRPKPVIKKKKE
ncbi:MAG: 4Fe-4S dicluster domain-containing protein [bacterium]|nr:4Fe-4S dicluster domain-containing protein [bacterium]